MRYISIILKVKFIDHYIYYVFRIQVFQQLSANSYYTIENILYLFFVYLLFDSKEIRN